uniref:Light-mediated development protein DET1 n=1 Tax=Ananas comosus var. bracteatus TaxID=296719 RepID=A0A6V7PH02_ANACO|nr:unnamed protein product [Ananas comosus var. bracteatus]
MFRSSNVAARVFERQILTPALGPVNVVRQFYENMCPSYTIYDIDCPDHSFRKFTDDGQYLDFFLYLENLQFGLFATSTAQSHDTPATEGAIHGVPSIEKITFYLVRLEDGMVLDEKAFATILSTFLIAWVRNIGAFCREDDQLFLHSHAQCIGTVDKTKPDELSTQVANGIQHPQVTQGSSFLSGMKQRLLSFIFRKTWNEEADQTLRVQHLKKKFYFHFQDYVDLIIWKVQFLDRHHLLIKFEFFRGMYSLFEQFCDHFHANSRSSFHANFISSHSNNIHALDQLCSIKTKASNASQFVKKMMTSLPYTCQSQSPSPYFDLSLFRSASMSLVQANILCPLVTSICSYCTDFGNRRHRHASEHPIKFISRRQPNVLKFKIKPGPEAGGSDARPKRISSFLFHPFLPLALSVQQTLMQPTVVNIHFRR